MTDHLEQFEEKLNQDEISADHREIREGIAVLLKNVESNFRLDVLLKGFADSMALYAHQVGKDLKIETGFGHVYIVRKPLEEKNKH